MLIFVHLPKTAGRSFGNALAEHFDGQTLREHDRLFPWHRCAARTAMQNAQNRLRGFSELECIQGHFMPLKYRFLHLNPKVRFVTWISDPVERLVSHYHFWQRIYDPSAQVGLLRDVIENNWFLERFCLSEPFRNFYSQYLWKFPLQFFDFFGITEHYEMDLEWFSDAVLQAPLSVRRDNFNEQRSGERYSLDKVFRADVARYHAKDMNIYQQALEMRSARQ